MFKRLTFVGAILSIGLMLLALPAFGTSQENSGNGMNRQGHRSEKLHGHDPGQDQGSEHNTADPDCTGNRTENPQATNIGECDAPTTGAADKPGGSGGFDEDKDWNNGCGNDKDREDDNNGHCGKPASAPPQDPPSTPPSTPPATPPSTQVLGESFAAGPSLTVAASSGPRPTAVLGAQFSRSLPRTGGESVPLTIIGLASVGAGIAMAGKRLVLR